MGLKEDIEAEVRAILRNRWTERDGQVVPVENSLQLSNDGIWLDATVLYADMDGSTELVDTKTAHFAAEIYKSFLHAAAKIIRSESGEITAYDGDRIMAVFIGDYKNTSAARAALKINYVREYIINPAILHQYPSSNFQLKHVVGVDTSPLFVARTGIRGANDLVWVGRAANHAAKLTTLSSEYPSRITGEVFDKMHQSAKVSQDGRSMWEQVTWNPTGRRIYRSTWWWAV